MAIPTNKDVDLVNWSTNANTRLNASPTTYGTTALVAAAYTAVHDLFIAAFDNLMAARAAGNRSQSLTSIKNDTKRNLLDFARPLYKTIQANTAVTDAAKIELGVHVPDVEPSPQPIPSTAPLTRVVSVNGRVVRVALRDEADPDRARIPAGIDGAIVMTYVGETAPTDPSLFTMQGPTSRTTVDIVFPESATPGTKVWITAVWFNERKQMGPASDPISTNINYGGSMPMAA